MGTRVTQLALPTAAITLLHAGPVEVGVLGALAFLAFPTLGLAAGVWVDRARRRPVLITCDVLRMLALGSIPVAWAAGVLSIWQLYVVAAVTGVGSVFFDVAYQSYLPALIEREDLGEGNSKLEVSRSAAGVLGPALAGFLIQYFRAAFAIAADALSYLVSVLALWWIRRPELDPRPGAGERSGFFAELWEGVRVVFGHPLIRPIAASTATSNLGSNVFFAVYLLFAYRQLGLSPGTVGVVFAIGSVGSLLGAMLATTVARRLGVGPTLTAAMLVPGPAALLAPLAVNGPAVPLLAVSFFLVSLCIPIYNINQVSLRQTIIPLRLQGRLNATVRTVIWGTIPIGSALGGLLGARLGLVPTLYVGAAISFLSVFWLLAGPVRLREMPAPID